MKIFEEIENSYASSAPSIITVGVFDGVHRGHQEILRKLIEEGNKKHYEKIVFTFKNHPLNIINSSLNPSLLTTFEEKVEIISSFSVDKLIAIQFNRHFADLNAEDFIRLILIEKLNMKELLLGYDATFGRNRSGTVDNIAKYGKLMNFSVHILDPEYSEQEIIKSSLIRHYLLEGNMKKVAHLSGRFYRLSGIVVKGEGRGHKYGFPTSNLKVSPEKLLPLRGVYAVRVYYKRQILYGIVNIGNKPTFGEHEVSIEIYILNFNQYLYGEYLTVELLDFIREERKFQYQEELYSQVREDIKKAEIILSLYRDSL
jgi:riboflavin kinase/FMN adenylyltransferase